MRDSFNYSTFTDLVYKHHDWQSQDIGHSPSSEQRQQNGQTSADRSQIAGTNSYGPWRGE